METTIKTAEEVDAQCERDVLEVVRRCGQLALYDVPDEAFRIRGFEGAQRTDMAAALDRLLEAKKLVTGSITFDTGPLKVVRLANRRGFASMPRAELLEVSSMGGKTAQASGKARRFTREEARAAGAKGGKKLASSKPGHMAEIGRKGGTAASRDREHMSRIGRKGGEVASANREHMAAIGRKGGKAKGKRKQPTKPSAADMDAPGGPVCWCGKPSTHQSGWCGVCTTSRACPHAGRCHGWSSVSCAACGTIAPCARRDCPSCGQRAKIWQEAKKRRAMMIALAADGANIRLPVEVFRRLA